MDIHADYTIRDEETLFNGWPAFVAVMYSSDGEHEGLAASARLVDHNPRDGWVVEFSVADEFGGAKPKYVTLPFSTRYVEVAGVAKGFTILYADNPRKAREDFDKLTCECDECKEDKGGDHYVN